MSRPRRHALVLCLFAAFVPPCAAAADKRSMEVADLFRFKRVADPQINPDGKLVVYQVTTVNFDENKSSTNLWLAAADGKTPPWQLTTTTKSDRHPRWSPDGKRILFESNRSGDWQLWVIDLGGGEALQLTHISTGASNGTWSPDGSHVAFVSSVYPEFSDKPFKESDALNKKKQDEIDKSPVKAKTFRRLFYRHWDEYVGDKRQHLFVLKLHYQKHESPVSPNPTWEPLDVTPGDRDANPTSSTFSVGDDFTFSPSGKYLVFTAPPERDAAWSTNYDLCRVPVTGGKIQTLTATNKAADNSPRFSPDGKRLAYRAQKKPGYEADKWDIYVVDCDADGAITGQPAPLLGKLDLSADGFAWYDDKEVIFAADQNGDTKLRRIALDGGMSIVPLDGVNGSISVSTRHSPPLVAFTNARLSRPPEVFAGWPGHKPGGIEEVSHANDALLAQLALLVPESVKVDVAGGTMQMWLLKPPGFDPSKKWPVVYLVHGGPQGAWEDGWSYRWNPELWAALGYVVALPNPRGSTGFGQKFVDEISGDWGGKCYDDLMKGADYVEKLPYVDKERIAAAGASFGGYMMNWFAVSTPRFKTLISHCSVWNFESMWGTTDELWFDEYEHGGLPWEKPGAYAKFSPHKKAANLGKFKTPMLLIQNDLDFRCPVGQGHELFSALQRQAVPSKLINFPDEGHWVLKPKNSEYWHKEVFAWLKKYCPPGGK
jgi:dipeptidyl aminopeptidase/acylaminoacyl peptidase